MPATQNFVMAKARIAAAAITKKRFVKMTADDTVSQCSVAGEGAYGVALYGVSTAEIAKGKLCSVLTEGRAVVEASAALTVGTQVATTNDGRAKAAATGDVILGTIDEPAGGAGDECSVVLSMASGAVHA